MIMNHKIDNSHRVTTRLQQRLSSTHAVEASAPNSSDFLLTLGGVFNRQQTAELMLTDKGPEIDLSPIPKEYSGFPLRYF